MIPLRVTIEESNKAKYFEVLAPWLTFVPFMGAQIVLIEKRIEVIFDCLVHKQRQIINDGNKFVERRASSSRSVCKISGKTMIIL